MPSIKSMLVLAFAAISAVSVQGGHLPVHADHDEGHHGNNTYTVTLYDQPGTAVSHKLRPTLYSKAKHVGTAILENPHSSVYTNPEYKYVAVTYTLGDRRVITKTITKTYEREEVKTHGQKNSPVWFVHPILTPAPISTTREVVNPKSTDASATKKGRKTITKYTTVTKGVTVTKSLACSTEGSPKYTCKFDHPKFDCAELEPPMYTKAKHTWAMPISTGIKQVLAHIHRLEILVTDNFAGG